MSETRLDVGPLGSSSRSVQFESPEHMVRTLGAHDEVLRMIESEFRDIDFLVRGNELL
ncbi:PhoH family protein, partial [Arthrobacter deserti]|nr:PhoH family protein [Arthrobacter deserti]